MNTCLWWHFGFKCCWARVLPMVGEISTLPALLPPNFPKFFFERRGLHPFVANFPNEEDHIHSFSLTQPSEDGESRQKPRGVKKKESDSTCQLAWFWFSVMWHVVVCCADFICGVCLFYFRGVSMTAYGVTYPDIMYWYMIIWYLCTRAWSVLFTSKKPASVFAKPALV